MSIDSLYISGFKVERPTFTNSGGINTKTYSTVSGLDNIKGRMRPLTGREILANEKIGLITTDRFYCDVVDIKKNDRITDSNTGKVYEVKNPKNPMSMNDHLEIDCEYKE